MPAKGDEGTGPETLAPGLNWDPSLAATTSSWYSRRQVLTEARQDDECCACCSTSTSNCRETGATAFNLRSSNAAVAFRKVFVFRFHANIMRRSLSS